MTLFLNLRATVKGGLVADQVTPQEVASSVPNPLAATSLVPDQIARTVAGRDVLLATHGFNVDWQSGVRGLSGWEPLLTLPSGGMMVGVLWPGDSRWAPIIDYPFEGGVAKKSGQLLAAFLNQWFAGAATISFASHSLGARVVLETIRGLSRQPRRLILMAGAIDDDCLTDEYKDAAAQFDSQTISVLASRKDEVLALAFPPGNLVEGILTPGHPFWHSAIGHAGPQAPCPTQVRAGWQIPDVWKFGHHNYLPPSPPPTVPLVPPTNLPQPPPPAVPPVPGPTSAWSAGFVSTRLI
jgi:alpha/beta hydrolase family protein DUF900